MRFWVGCRQLFPNPIPEEYPVIRPQSEGSPDGASTSPNRTSGPHLRERTGISYLKRLIIGGTGNMVITYVPGDAATCDCEPSLQVYRSA